MFFKTCIGDFHPQSATFFGVWEVGRIVGLELPFARDASAIPCIFHQMTEGAFLRIQNAKVGPVPVVVLACHDLHTSGGAERLGVGMGETQSVGCQLIDVWGLVRFTSVASDSFDPNIIGHDKNDVGFGGGS